MRRLKTGRILSDVRPVVSFHVVTRADEMNPYVVIRDLILQGHGDGLVASRP
jgi:hypothetical protein